MILEALLNMVFALLKIVFGWISLPAFPEALTSSVETFLNLIFDNITLLGFFIRPATIMVVVPILIVLLNFEDIYKITMWILRKIPFLRFAVKGGYKCYMLILIIVA